MKNKLILVIIILIAFILRFYQLNNFPTGFQRDEAFIGYNTYSILKTGREMSGDFLPTHLRSFLFTPAGNVYISAPFVSIFGLSKFSIRFSSALFGLLSIPLLYLVLKEFLQKEKGLKNIGCEISLFASFLFAISPWHINLSRTSSVVTPVVFFILLGIFLYFRSVNKGKALLLFASFASFFISLFFYISPYTFLPIFIPSLFFFYKTKYEKLFFFFYILLIIIPLIITLLSGNLSTRVNSISIIKNGETSLRIGESAREDGVAKINSGLVRFFHNKPSVLSTIFLQNYFDHLSYSFLFTEKSFPDRYRVPRMGIMYLFEFALLILGVIFVIKNNLKLGYFLIFWALVAPIGSSLSFDDVPNMQRTLYMLPPLLILETIGVYYLVEKLNLKRWFPILFLIIFLNIFYYLHQYYIHGAVYHPWYRQEGYETLVKKLNTYLPNYKKAIITNRESGPSVEVAFFSKFSPSAFLEDTKNQDVQNSDMVSFGKYTFSNEECPLREEIKNGSPVITGEKDIVYVDSGLCKIPKNVKVLETILRSDNSIVYYILTLK